MTWAELAQVRDPTAYNLFTVPQRLADVGDPWEAMDARHFSIEPLLRLYDESGLGELPFPPDYPKMPGEPPRVQPSKKAAAPVAGDVLELADLQAGEDRMRGQMAAMCRARWDSASELEQSFLAAMADYAQEIVPREHIAHTMGRDTRSISVPRARLIDRGVIEAAGRGRLRFTLPGMAAWVRDHHGG